MQNVQHPLAFFDTPSVVHRTPCNITNTPVNTCQKVTTPQAVYNRASGMQLEHPRVTVRVAARA
jgi:hypothetical protein